MTWLEVCLRVVLWWREVSRLLRGSHGSIGSHRCGARHRAPLACRLRLRLRTAGGMLRRQTDVAASDSRRHQPWRLLAMQKAVLVITPSSAPWEPWSLQDMKCVRLELRCSGRDHDQVIADERPVAVHVLVQVFVGHEVAPRVRNVPQQRHDANGEHAPLLLADVATLLSEVIPVASNRVLLSNCWSLFGSLWVTARVVLSHCWLSVFVRVLVFPADHCAGHTQLVGFPSRSRRYLCFRLITSTNKKY